MMIKPFSAETAFFFPSKVWVAVCLSLFTYVYILIQSIQMVGSIESGLLGLLNKIIETSLQTQLVIDAAYTQSTGSDLPDSALAPMSEQLLMIKGWFSGLISAIQIGASIGIAVAAVVILVLLLLFFLNFRWRVLALRHGHYSFPPKFALLPSDSKFMGELVASTIVGFVVIVLICTLVALPFAWSLPWKMLWNNRNFILYTLVLPQLIQPIISFVLKKFLYDKKMVRHRAAASYYIFYQTFLTIPAGIAGGIVRFGISLVCLMLSLPQIHEAATPDFLNQIILLDSAHKTFLSTCYMHHLHNHPIMCATVSFLQDLARRRKKLDDEGCDMVAVRQAAIKRNKRWLIVLLIHMPWLKKYRKAALKEEQEKKKKEKEQRKLAAQAAKAKIGDAKVVEVDPGPDGEDTSVAQTNTKETKTKLSKVQMEAQQKLVEMQVKKDIAARGVDIMRSCLFDISVLPDKDGDEATAALNAAVEKIGRVSI